MAEESVNVKSMGSREEERSGTNSESRWLQQLTTLPGLVWKNFRPMQLSARQPWQGLGSDPSPMQTQVMDHDRKRTRTIFSWHPRVTVRGNTTKDE